MQLHGDAEAAILAAEENQQLALIDGQLPLADGFTAERLVEDRRSVAPRKAEDRQPVVRDAVANESRLSLYARSRRSDCL